jgi:hypothetical protein
VGGDGERGLSGDFSGVWAGVQRAGGLRRIVTTGLQLSFLAEKENQTQRCRSAL